MPKSIQTILKQPNWDLAMYKYEQFEKQELNIIWEHLNQLNQTDTNRGMQILNQGRFIENLKALNNFESKIAVFIRQAVEETEQKYLIASTINPYRLLNVQLTKQVDKLMDTLPLPIQKQINPKTIESAIEQIPHAYSPNKNYIEIDLLNAQFYLDPVLHKNFHVLARPYHNRQKIRRQLRYIQNNHDYNETYPTIETCIQLFRQYIAFDVKLRKLIVKYYASHPFDNEFKYRTTMHNPFHLTKYQIKQIKEA